MTSRENGILIGVVTSLEDPENLGRVKVRFPHLEDKQSDWARLVSPMAGKERGLFMRPEVDDEVLVVFEYGDPRRPHIVGALWNSEDKLPPELGEAKKNDIRSITSRSGHVIKLDDTDGEQKIEIFAKDGKQKIVLDAAKNLIQVDCDSVSVEIKGSGDVKVTATKIEIEASGDMTLSAGGNMTIKGAKVDINP
ncbi:MAG: phage tail protein [Anaerolineaceae bacterium]|nr:phage tail protein [Anaerolineaceae bacterium]